MRSWTKLLISTGTGGVLLWVLTPLAPRLRSWWPGEPGVITLDIGPRVDLIASLASPRKVRGWTASGLVLDDGEVESLPDIELLPERSTFLERILERGVEVDPDDGRVYGLIPIHHWCGNDPVGRHIARVDVARVLEFTGEGGGSGNSIPETGRSDCGSASEWAWTELGWDVSCHFLYERWLEAMERR